jgi:aminoglycoside phosphotransferase (APT) family kinase protein
MTDETKRLPNEEDAAHIVRRVLNEPVLTVNRFPTGACHFVYDVVTESGRNVVARISWPENRHFLAGAIYWYGWLKPKGLPLATIVSHDIEAKLSPFPYMILERLAGKDLGAVYQQLSRAQKKTLANEIVRLQKLAGSLPLGRGFGFVKSYKSASFHSTWIDVLHSLLNRSRSRIQAAGIMDVRQVDRAAKKLENYTSYFAQIAPRCFLDDVTTRNVIVHDGKLSGIVDVDFVCFGDNLLCTALTQMSLINSRADLNYIDYWCEAADVTEQQREVLVFYTALFCVDFMGELGQQFNKDHPESINRERVLELNDALDKLLSLTKG